MGRLEQAEEFARRAVAADPDRASALLTLSRVLNNRGDRDGAIEVAARLLAVRPDLSVSHYWYASLLGDAARFAEGLAHAREAVRLNPGSALELGVLARTASAVAGCADEARAAAAELLRTAPADPVAQDLARGVYTRLGDWERARETAQAVVDARPADPVARFRLGEALLNLGRYAEAGAAFMSTLQQRPSQDQLETTAVVLLEAGLPEEMRELFGRVCAALGRPDPTVPHAAGTDERLIAWQLEAAELLVEEAGRPDMARPILLGLFADNPGHPDVRTALAELAYDTDGDAQSAWELVAPLVESGHDSADAHGVAVHALADLGRLDEAVALARACRGRWPHSTLVFEYMEAYCHGERRDHAAVLEATEHGLARWPHHPGLLYLRGRSQLTFSVEEGLPTLRAAIAADPDFHEPYVWLALALGKLGDRAGAAEAVATAERLSGLDLGWALKEPADPAETR
ncbi:tetratricopeptide (TPR) repeat protein [Streptomonospora nanhaiensis]|uniref:Tetratricopeptide (TPR) repeat protein n=2 Tax=Streptomonospora nanhaiensis TaxID=1323731 RepID=A0A853BR45_9ACTN|nr:tetratricopeptide repeat protein [Streptomonospora nanhaiensis]NYI98199.1 tetratricopeptide (TPR) repeat protein [Streptomonospora nanhaiensis]